MSNVWGIIVVGLMIVGLGLILRYGRSSIGLAKIGSQSASNTLADLTLKGSGYGYYGPAEG